jgi:hypothetical protein
MFLIPLGWKYKNILAEDILPGHVIINFSALEVSSVQVSSLNKMEVIFTNGRIAYYNKTAKIRVYYKE